MAVITKSDIAEINNDLSNIKSELSEKLFLHEKEQDEKIERMLDQLGVITNAMNANVEYTDKQIIAVNEVNSNFNRVLKIILNLTEVSAEEISEAKKQIKILKYVTAFLAIVSVIALLK